MPGKTQMAVPFDLTNSAGGVKERRVLTADITINGRRLGESAEALVD